MGKLSWRFCEVIINSTFELQDSTGAIDLRPATAEETIDVGCVAWKPRGWSQGLRVLADLSLRGRRITGANEDEWRLAGLTRHGHFVEEWVDLREVESGKACIDAVH